MPKRSNVSRDAIPGLAERLLEARTAKKLSQRELGDLAGLPHSKIANIEGGGMKSGATGRTLIKLADALGVSLDWLCGRQEPPAKPRR